MGQFIKDSLDKLSRQAKVTTQDMADFTDEALKRAANMSTSSALNIKREAPVLELVAVVARTMRVGVILIVAVVVATVVVVIAVVTIGSSGQSGNTIGSKTTM